ncbi:DUF1963 domain-containing protein [Streptomyces sp. NPDC090445]|uniref:DUF1963 domain-containing protein n=1 Tax=Streptomyces sp. NPDC090445 TaxID=3365963 RepID=UPI0037F65E43
MDEEWTDGMQARALREIAWRYLPDEDAVRWASLLRPGVRLVDEAEAEAEAEDEDVAGAGAGAVAGAVDETGDAAEPPAAARLGGLPRLPDGTAWPTGPAGAPLAFVAAVDCAALPARALDVPVPPEGVLAFFASAPLHGGPDGRYRSGEAGPTPGRVVHIPADAPGSVRTAPPGVPVFPSVRLAARPELTAPFPEHPRVRDAFALHTWEDPYDHPLYGQGFLDELAEHGHRFEHRVGGYAVCAGAVPVEYEAAAAAADADAAGAGGGRAERVGPLAVGAQDTGRAREWVLLAQFQCDPADGVLAAKAPSGGGRRGVLAWLIHREDLARGRFAESVLLRRF